ncbi:MAG: hypothetical protein A2516_03240, partial [Alphaproteobacteria bacterium RIFOXYD12_FULL_60_8]
MGSLKSFLADAIGLSVVCAAGLAGAAEVTGVRVGEHANATRFVLDMTGAPLYRYAVSADRRQIVIDLPHSDWVTEAVRTVRNSQFVQGYRYDDKRLFIDTTTPVYLSDVRVLLPGAEGKHRLYFDLTAAAPESVSLPPPELPPSPSPRAAIVPPPEPAAVAPATDPQIAQQPPPTEPPREPQKEPAPGWTVTHEPIAYPRFYAGVGAGLSSTDTGFTDLTGTAALDEEDTGWKLFGGAELTDLLAVEGFYADFGEATLSGNNGDTFKYGDTTYTFTSNGEVLAYAGTTMGAGGVLGYDINEFFRPFAKLGLHYWEIDASFTSTTTTLNRTDSGVDGYGGLGLQVNLTDWISLRAEYERFLFGNETVDLASGSVVG